MKERTSISQTALSLFYKSWVEPEDFSAARQDRMVKCGGCSIVETLGGCMQCKEIQLHADRARNVVIGLFLLDPIFSKQPSSRCILLCGQSDAEGRSLTPTSLFTPSQSSRSGRLKYANSFPRDCFLTSIYVLLCERMKFGNSNHFCDARPRSIFNIKNR